MRWAVEIQKTGLSRRRLTDLLNALGYDLVDGIDYPALSGPSLEVTESSEQVWSAAKDFRDAVTGPAEIDPTFQLGSVIDYSYDKPRRHAFLEVQSSIHSVSSMQATLTLRPPDGLSEFELEAWHARREEQEYQQDLDAQLAKLVPAFSEPRAVKLLALLKQEEHTGDSINKMYELAEGQPSNRQNFQNQFGISRTEFDRFRDAVHNPVVSGDKARHAYPQNPRSLKPMNLKEAESFARRLAAKWLASITAAFKQDH